MKHNIMIRKATLEDAEDLTKLNIKCWQNAYAGMMDGGLLSNLSGIFTIDGYKDSLSHEHNIYVALLDNRIAGFIIYGLPRDGKSNNHFEIHALYVDKDFIGHGIGYKLLKYVEHKLLECGMNVSIIIWTLAANKPAQDFYVRQGYNFTDARKDFTIGGNSYPEVQFIKNITL